jgi:hypothetical protein
MKNLKCVTILVIILLTLSFSETVLAKKKGANQSGPATFSVSPPSYDLQCTAGEKKTLTVKLANPNPVAGTATLLPVGYIVDGKGQLVMQPIASLSVNSLARHMIIETAVINIPANSFKEVSLTLDIPEGLKGTQYAGFSASSVLNLPDDVDRPEEYINQVSVGINTGLGVKIKCQMQGTLEYSYKLEKMEFVSAKGNSVPVIVVTVKNIGNVEIEFLPTVILMDASKKAVARLKGEKMVKLVAGATETMEMRSSFTRIPPGTYDAILTLANSVQPFEPSQAKLTVGN